MSSSSSSSSSLVSSSPSLAPPSAEEAASSDDTSPQSWWYAFHPTSPQTAAFPGPGGIPGAQLACHAPATWREHSHGSTGPESMGPALLSVGSLAFGHGHGQGTDAELYWDDACPPGPPGFPPALGQPGVDGELPGGGPRTRDFVILSTFVIPCDRKGRKARRCDACRRRKTACIITSESPCLFCQGRGIVCQSTPAAGGFQQPLPGDAEAEPPPAPPVSSDEHHTWSQHPVHWVDSPTEGEPHNAQDEQTPAAPPAAPPAGLLPSGEPPAPIFCQMDEHFFPCKVCGKGFTSPGHVKQHMQAHTAKRRFPCGICGKGFTTPGHVKQHMRSHTHQRCFPCDICGKRFTSLVYVKQHMQSHTHERPFPCDVCIKRFTSLGYLIRHLKSHTQERQFITSGVWQPIAMDAPSISE